MSKSSSQTAHLRVDGLSKTFPDRRVLTNISFSVPHHDRVAIIGENGAGKTTLLRLIAGELSSDAGHIESFAQAQHGLDIGLLHQEPEFGYTMSIAQVLEASVARFRAAETAVHDAAEALSEQPHDPATLQRYTEAVDQAEQLSVWETDTRIESTMNGLGLRDLQRQRRIGELSGGQRARLALAGLLLRAPQLLLLDEPTNHLDDAAIQYLSTVVDTWHGPVLIVSHDRAFLDDTVVSILDLDPAPIPKTANAPDEEPISVGVTRFSGTYTDYLAARDQARQRWQQQYEAEQAQLARLRAAVDDNQVVGHRDWKPRSEVRMAQKYYADRNAKVVARRVNDARARLTDLEQRQIMKPPRQLSFGGLNAAGSALPAISSDQPLITADQAAVPGRLSPTTLSISATDKLLITGANGAGKSTLLQLLAGQLQPTHGTVHIHAACRIALLAQESSFNHAPGQTAKAFYEQAVGLQLAEQVPLATFGLLHSRDEQRSIDTLSIGQQRRLALAVVLADPPDVLILDEPTNHLSVVLATELELSIEDFPGAVVVASHDRWLRQHWQGIYTHVEQ